MSYFYEEDDVRRDSPLDRIVRPTRPLSLTVIAVIHFIFGGLGLLTSFCAGAYLVVGPSLTPPRPEKYFDRAEFSRRMERELNNRYPAQVVITAILVVINLGLAATLIGAGVGLLHLRPWARTASLVYAWITIVEQCYNLLFTLFVSIPFRTEFIKSEEARKPNLDIISRLEFPLWVGPVFICSLMIYALAVLITLTRTSVVRAFRQG